MIASVGLNVVLLVVIAVMTHLPPKAATAARPTSTAAPAGAPSTATPAGAPTPALAAPGIPTPSAAPSPLTGLFEFTSETGDYIGQGLTKQFGPPHDTLTITPEGGGDSAAATTSGFTVHVSAADAEYWDITVAPPHGQLLHAGTYSVATRAPFQGGDSAGLDVTGDSRGCNTSFDSFTINQIVSNSAGVISAVDVSFTQHCEQATAPTLTGRVQIRT